MNIHGPAYGGETYDYLPIGEEPNAYDVICERGVTGASHEGNREFSLVILNWRPTYSGLFFDINDNSKKIIVSKIIKHIKNGRDHPGRFVSRDKATKRWYKAPEAVEQKRVAQALRDAHAPQWAYEQKLTELRPLYQGAETDDEREEIINFILIYLRGGRLDKGHFKSFKSTRVANEPGAKRRFRTETKETVISDEDAADWVRRELEARERPRMNQGIKYVIEGSQKNTKKRGVKAKSSTKAISERIKAMQISDTEGDHSRRSRIEPPKKMKVAPASPGTYKNSQHRRVVPKNILPANGSAHRRTMMKEDGSFRNSRSIFGSDMGSGSFRNSRSIFSSDLGNGSLRNSRTALGSDIGSGSFRNSRSIFSSDLGNGSLRNSRTTLGSDTLRGSETPKSMDMDSLAALFESKQPPPITEIVLGGADQAVGDHVDRDRRRDFQSQLRSQSFESAMSGFDGEMALASDKSTTSHRRKLFRWRSGSNRSFSSFGRATKEDLDMYCTSPGSIGTISLGASNRNTLSEETKAAMMDAGLHAFSPGSLQSSITGNLSHALLSFKGETLPLHDGTVPLNDAESCISLPNSINSTAGLGGASVNSALAAPVSPGKIF